MRTTVLIVNTKNGQEWAIFIVCFLITCGGVGLSFLVFDTAVHGARTVAGVIGITLAMLLISYGVKADRDVTRRTLTPFEFLHFSVQGFLWPGAWPALATVLGMTTVAGPH